MQASETRLQQIIEGTKQYVVPLFQRPYSWGTREWSMLWDDLNALLEDSDIHYHFIGSIVTLQTISVPQGVNKFLLIDGQQRLTTIFILLALIRDRARELQIGNLTDKIHDLMLVNKYSEGLDYYRILPTQVDRDMFCQLIDQKEVTRSGGKGKLEGIQGCYDFFHGKISRFDAERLKALQEVIIGRLSTVSIVLDSNDNPHLVFESLNAKGKPLTQADLVRNFFFMRVHTNVEGLKLELQNRDYPSDAAFKKSLMSDRLYGAGDRRDRTRFILETIEASFEHKEPILFDRLSIEHIMPQTLTDWWVQHLGDEAEEDHAVYVHTLGNLTLTGYNSELSNSSFPEKQKLLAESHLELNRYFRSCSKWTSEEIQHRAEALADRAIHIWAYFGSKQRSISILTPRTATGKTPTTLTLLGQRIPVRTWIDVLTKTLQTIAEQYPEGFEQFARDYPRVISDNPAKLKRGTQLRNDMYVELNMGAKEIVSICQRAVALAELHPDMWQVEVRESGADSTLNPA